MVQADAPVVLIECTSANRPHCAEFHVKVLPEIKAQYIDRGKMKFVFRELPLDSMAGLALVAQRVFGTQVASQTAR